MKYKKNKRVTIAIPEYAKSHDKIMQESREKMQYVTIGEIIMIIIFIISMSLAFTLS